jgi:TetR/AcrR family transcriptional repressor of lmrAB and yxaGH operons
MLAAAGDLLQERGLHGISLGEILERSNAPKGSMYFHFPGGKEELVREAMMERVRFVNGVLESCFADAPDEAEAVRRYVELAAQGLRDSDYRLGCPIAPIVFDHPDKTSDLARAVEETVTSWHEAFVRHFLAAGVTKERAGTLATVIIATLEGALLMARAQRDIAPAVTVAEQLAVMVRDALPDTSR